MLKELEQIGGKPIYFHPGTLELTNKPPKGLFDQLKDWWVRSRPSWLR